MTPTIGDTARGRFAGVRMIIRNNAHWYAAAALVAALSSAIAETQRATTVRLAGGTIAAGTALMTVASLAVSHYIYDTSPLMRWDWLGDLRQYPARWLNLHAGADEATPALRQLFGQSSGTVIDIFDASQMKSRSIAVARRAGAAVDPVAGDSLDDLPDGAAFDTVYVIFAAHELRHPDARVRLFARIRRLLATGGSVIVVEHTRNLANLAAFGPGAFHFFSRHTWLRTFSTAGFRVRETRSMTAFVSAFVLEVTE